MYIQNQGITQTIIQENHHRPKINQIKWDADYDGHNANIVIQDNQHNQVFARLDNNDLTRMLNHDSVNIPIDKRLHTDFGMPPKHKYKYKYKYKHSHRRPNKNKHFNTRHTVKRRLSTPRSSQQFIAHK